MADMRDRLIELLENCPDVIPSWYGDYKEAANYLLANGVILPPCKVGDETEETNGKKKL